MEYYSAIKKNTFKSPPELAYLAAYIAEELEAPPPKGTENLPGITLSFRQWFFLDTVYICVSFAISHRVIITIFLNSIYIYALIYCIGVFLYDLLHTV